MIRHIIYLRDQGGIYKMQDDRFFTTDHVYSATIFSIKKRNP